MPARQHEREAGAPVLSRANLQRRLAAIAQQRGNLQHQWLDVFGSRPPKRLSTALLVLALSYHAQADKDDGLRESESRCARPAPRGMAWRAHQAAQKAQCCVSFQHPAAIICLQRGFGCFALATYRNGRSGGRAFHRVRRGRKPRTRNRAGLNTAPLTSPGSQIDQARHASATSVAGADS